jgi:hypothetical protein
MEESTKNIQNLLRNRASQYGFNEINDNKVDISKADILKKNNSNYGTSYNTSYNKYLKYKDKYLKLKKNL